MTDSAYDKTINEYMDLSEPTVQNMVDQNPEWDDSESHNNKTRGTGTQGVHAARGAIDSALSYIDDEDTHLCADGQALLKTIQHLSNAIMFLTQDIEEVPGVEE